MVAMMGWVALGCYVVHALNHFRRGEPADTLWVCHLAAAVIGVGLLLGRTDVALIGVLWLVPGTPLWIWDALRGRSVILTSPLTHLIAPAAGLVALAQTGSPTGVWWTATAGMLGMHILSRFITPADRNINMAHHVHPGFAGAFRSLNLFIVVITAGFAVIFFAAERLLAAIWPAAGAG